MDNEKVHAFKDSLQRCHELQDMIWQMSDELDSLKYEAFQRLKDTVDNGFTTDFITNMMHDYEKSGFTCESVQKVVNFALDNCISHDNMDKSWHKSLKCTGINCYPGTSFINVNDHASSRILLDFMSCSDSTRLFQLGIPVRDGVFNNIHDWESSSNGLYTISGHLLMEEDNAMRIASKTVAKVFDTSLLPHVVDMFMTSCFDDDIIDYMMQSHIETLAFAVQPQQYGIDYFKDAYNSCSHRYSVIQGYDGMQSIMKTDAKVKDDNIITDIH